MQPSRLLQHRPCCKLVTSWKIVHGMPFLLCQCGVLTMRMGSLMGSPAGCGSHVCIRLCPAT